MSEYFQTSKWDGPDSPAGGSKPWFSAFELFEQQTEGPQDGDQAMRTPYRLGLDELSTRFSRKTANDRQIEATEGFRAALKNIAIELYSLVPQCRERELAFDGLEKAMMYLEAGILRRGLKRSKTAPRRDSA